jgi:tryptophan-rich sensory protein
MTATTRWIGLAVFIFICFAAAGIGSSVTTPQIPGGCTDLAKPAWNPPKWIFGPVWSCLYLMMAVAARPVWQRRGFAVANLPLTLFAIQLVLNSLWSVLFFGLQNPGAAAGEIVLLWMTILATLIAF